MLKKLVRLPVRVASFLAARIMGRNTAPPAEPPPPPPRRKPPPPRPAAEAEDRGHDHGHSHDHGGGHDHGHDHGEARAEAAPAPKAEKAEKVEKPAPEKAEKAPEKAEKPEAPRGEKAEPKKRIDVTAEETPNPNARKFTCSVTVVEKGSLTFSSAEEADGHPLGKAIWALGGVKTVFAVKDFVTVTKTDEAEWSKLSPKVVKAIKSAF